jgi:hypothetical protein
MIGLEVLDMSRGKFTKAYLPAGGDVTVIGPFNPADDAVNVARIVFLIVQGRKQGTALDTVVVRGEGKWHRTQPGPGLTEWRGTCPRSGDTDLGPSNKNLEVGANVITRGIALSIVVQRGEQPKQGATTFDPPSIEALNWCADVEIVGGNAPAPSTTT